MKKSATDLYLNLGLLIISIIMMFSGLFLQIKYHFIRKGALDEDYLFWSNIHTITSILFAILVVFHIVKHWKWFKAVVRKKLFSKNRPVIILSSVFLITTITGFIAYSLKLNGIDVGMRKVFVEIHDKIAIILMFFLVAHFLKRIKWYFSAYKKIRT